MLRPAHTRSHSIVMKLTDNPFQLDTTYLKWVDVWGLTRSNPWERDISKWG